MRTRSFGARAFAASCLLLAGTARADLAAVRACVEANAPKRSAILELSVDAHEKDGASTLATRLKLYWRRLADGERRLLLRFREPEELRDVALLVNEKDGRRPIVHLYLPEQGRPRSVRSRGELSGFLGRANLGVEEIEQLLEPLAGQAVTLRTEGGSIEGRPVWILDESTADDEEALSRTVLFVDREYCIPLRADFYDPAGVHRKRLDVDPESVTRVLENWVPGELVFHDLARERRTVLRVERVELEAAFSPALLTVRALDRPGG